MKYMLPPILIRNCYPTGQFGNCFTVYAVYSAYIARTYRSVIWFDRTTLRSYWNSSYNFINLHKDTSFYRMTMVLRVILLISLLSITAVFGGSGKR